LFLILTLANSAGAQLTTSRYTGNGAIDARYLRGQSIQPIYEGWEQNPDGTYSLWFGYLNRNWEQRLDIPVGPDNHIEPGGAGAANAAAALGSAAGAASASTALGWDSGQPTIFQTGEKRRQMFAFRVVVPADWPKDRDVVWTLTANGTRLQAYGSLWPVWMINEDVISANRGALRDTRADGVRNRPPIVTAILKDAVVPVGTPLTLSVAVIDDDLPKRRRPGQLWGAGDEGSLEKEPPLRDSLRVSWVQWRGPGTATFDPDVARVRDANGKQTSTAGQAVTTVTFDRPGHYVLRVYAEDMSLFAIAPDVTVTVTDSSSVRLRQ
jgi:hypothetical protein